MKETTNVYDACLRMDQRFGQDTVIALATMEAARPSVRMVNAYYHEGSFYVITHALSHKMEHIARNPHVGICGEWMTAHGIAVNRGGFASDANQELACTLRKVFHAWIDNGHTDCSDPNTCILEIRLTDALLLDHGTRYEMEFDPLDRSRYPMV